MRFLPPHCKPVSRKRFKRVMSEAAHLIQGKATKGAWVKIRGEVYGPTNYNALKKDLELLRAENPNDLPCEMCSEGAILAACALEGMSQAEAFDCINQAEEAYKHQGVIRAAESIPAFNDRPGHSRAKIESTLELVATAIEKED